MEHKSRRERLLEALRLRPKEEPDPTPHELAQSPDNAPMNLKEMVREHVKHYHLMYGPKSNEIETMEEFDDFQMPGAFEEDEMGEPMRTMVPEAPEGQEPVGLDPAPANVAELQKELEEAKAQIEALGGQKPA
jgi:hypothetical protein